MIAKTIPVKVLYSNAKLPKYGSQGAAGADLFAHITCPVVIKPQETVSIPTGIALEIPEGYEGQVRSRSGLAFKHHVCIPHGLGTIDSDYRGEVMMLLHNFGTESYTVNPEDRIAQLVIASVEHCAFVPVLHLSETSRDQGGFGSTGT